MKIKLREEVLPASGRGYVHVCPHCGAELTLYDLRDGDQAYWCHACQKGQRIGEVLAEALRPLAQTG